MTRSLRILIFPEYPVEKPHVVVDTVSMGLLPARGHSVTVIRPARSAASTLERHAAPWGTGELITFPDEPAGSAISNIGRARRKVRWLKRAMQRLRRWVLPDFGMGARGELRQHASAGVRACSSPP